MLKRRTVRCPVFLSNQLTDPPAWRNFARAVSGSGSARWRFVPGPAQVDACIFCSAGNRPGRQSKPPKPTSSHVKDRWKVAKKTLNTCYSTEWDASSVPNISAIAGIDKLGPLRIVGPREVRCNEYLIYSRSTGDNTAGCPFFVPEIPPMSRQFICQRGHRWETTLGG